MYVLTLPVGDCLVLSIKKVVRAPNNCSAPKTGHPLISLGFGVGGLPGRVDESYEEVKGDDRYRYGQPVAAGQVLEPGRCELVEGTGHRRGIHHGDKLTAMLGTNFGSAILELAQRQVAGTVVTLEPCFWCLAHWRHGAGWHLCLPPYQLGTRKSPSPHIPP